jgi:hypothetical protein
MELTLPPREEIVYYTFTMGETMGPYKELYDKSKINCRD